MLSLLFNYRHHYQQYDLYHNFVDFRKAFDRVLLEGVFQVMKSSNFNFDIVQITTHYKKMQTSVVLLSSRQIRQIGRYSDGHLGDLTSNSSDLSQL